VGGTSVVSDCLIRIAKTGSDTNDGSSWSLALQMVQKGLDNAAAKIAATTCSAVELWVAAGTYTPTYSSDSTDPRTATFQLVANVALYGGFNGTESDRPSRDITANVTTLSGDIGATGDNSDNSYHVVKGKGGATLDGFSVTGGNSDGTGSAYGGGMYSISSSDQTVANCTFIDNRARYGAGLYNSGPLTVVDSTFANNVAMVNGGAIANSSSYTLTVTNSTFTSNSAGNDGGGIYNEDSVPARVKGCTFANNSAKNGGALFNTGDSSPYVDNCTFTGNSASSYGGAIYNFDLSSPLVQTCTFTNNSATYGGAIFDGYQCSTYVNHCTFTDNHASSVGGAFMANASTGSSVSVSTFTGNSASLGGAIAVYSAGPSVNNCTFTGNSATRGGAIYDTDAGPQVINSTFTGNSATEGGAMQNEDSTPLVTNSTFWANSASSTGGAINTTGSTSLPWISNTILWGDRVGTTVSELVAPSALWTVTYSIIEGGYPSGTGIINADPLLVDPANGNFRLTAQSPAVDAGDYCATNRVPLYDKDIKGRWDIASKPNSISALDIGAYEYQGTDGADTVVSAFSCE
jgi:predicted outer membrane repeat protein